MARRKGRKKGGARKKSKNMKPGTPPPAPRAPAQQRQHATGGLAGGGAARSSSARRNLAQKRAAHALQAIETIGNDYGNYVSYVKALPAAIIMSGLGQAMAMEKAGASKTGDVRKGHERLYEHMQSWLCTGWESSPYNRSDLLDGITNKPEAAYIRAQAEALEYLEWLKKFAVAFLDEREAEQ